MLSVEIDDRGEKGGIEGGVTYRVWGCEGCWSSAVRESEISSDLGDMRFRSKSRDALLASA